LLDCGEGAALASGGVTAGAIVAARACEFRRAEVFRRCAEGLPRASEVCGP